MKKQEEKKLRLGKITIQDLDSTLDRDEQKAVKGGSGTTDLIAFCKP